MSLSGDSDLDMSAVLELKQQAAKPLMYPRQRVHKQYYDGNAYTVSRRPCWGRLFWAFIYLVIFVCAVSAIIFFIVYLVQKSHLITVNHEENKSINKGPNNIETGATNIDMENVDTDKYLVKTNSNIGEEYFNK